MLTLVVAILLLFFDVELVGGPGDGGDKDRSGPGTHSYKRHKVNVPCVSGHKTKIVFYESYKTDDTL